VLSPFLFGIVIDDLVKLVNKANCGCRVGAYCTAIFLYADDVILLAPSVSTLQTLVNICELELVDLDMAINVKKSACMRFGSRYKNTCANIVAAGVNIDWVTSTRYLGVYFESSVRFKCSFSSNKAGFYKSFNAIFGKIGRCASEEVVFALIKTKCLPVLLYGTEVCPVNAADLQSIQFTINRVIIKLFGTMTRNCYQEVSNYFGINTAKELIHNRFEKFRISYGAADNYLCRQISARC